ncbi:hypothetical protein [Olleya sp. HaHaR_3_96]|uniref:hypothetical protein n=1 Tax=Olleya sp. HaHaR_3_96 TaxID=2745560 RepID=UPI001C4FB641|nr:hypothetical protein [Olleya sp. HaHaR_3_96]QXP58306.1 hypothetical protein H0I26_10270 [Olleya sp. HaHaR_3_96]
MARRIYRILIVISLALGYHLFTIKNTHTKTYVVIISSLIFMLLSIGIHGLIAHSLKPDVKGDIILYPILMGALWAVLFFLFVFFILPVYCPDFHLFK